MTKVRFCRMQRGGDETREHWTVPESLSEYIGAMWSVWMANLKVESVVVSDTTINIVGVNPIGECELLFAEEMEA